MVPYKFFQCFPEMFLIRYIKITEVPLFGSSKHRCYFISEGFVPCECNWITTFFPGLICQVSLPYQLENIICQPR